MPVNSIPNMKHQRGIKKIKIQYRTLRVNSVSLTASWVFNLIHHNITHTKNKKMYIYKPQVFSLFIYKITKFYFIVNEYSLVNNL